jgi:hypothetical protein
MWTSGTGHVRLDLFEDAAYAGMSKEYASSLCGIDGRRDEGDACVWKTVSTCRWHTRILPGKWVPFSTDSGVGSIACVLDSAGLSLVLSLASKKEQMRRVNANLDELRTERGAEYHIFLHPHFYGCIEGREERMNPLPRNAQDSAGLCHAIPEFEVEFLALKSLELFRKVCSDG